MPMFPHARSVQVYGGQFNDVSGDQVNYYDNSKTDIRDSFNTRNNNFNNSFNDNSSRGTSESPSSTASSPGFRGASYSPSGREFPFNKPGKESPSPFGRPSAPHWETEPALAGRARSPFDNIGLHPSSALRKAERAAERAAKSFPTSGPSRGSPSSNIVDSYNTYETNISNSNNDHSVHTNNFKISNGNRNYDSHDVKIDNSRHDSHDVKIDNRRYDSHNVNTDNRSYDSHNFNTDNRKYDSRDRYSVRNGSSTKTHNRGNSSVDHSNISGGLTKSGVRSPNPSSRENRNNPFANFPDVASSPAEWKAREDDDFLSPRSNEWRRSGSFEGRRSETPSPRQSSEEKQPRARIPSQDARSYTDGSPSGSYLGLPVKNPVLRQSPDRMHASSQPRSSRQDLPSESSTSPSQAHSEQRVEVKQPSHANVLDNVTGMLNHLVVEPSEQNGEPPADVGGDASPSGKHKMRKRDRLKRIFSISHKNGKDTKAKM